MTARRTRTRFIAIAVAMLLLAVPIAPAAAIVPVVAPGVTISGTPLQGMTAEEASAAIALAAPASALATIPVEADGRTFVLSPAGTLILDVDGLVADALAAPEGASLAARYSVDTTAVTKFAGVIAATVNRKAVSAHRVISHRRLKIAAPVIGVEVDTAAAVTLLGAALLSDASGAAVTTVTVPVTYTNPRTTLANIGKTIIVSLREFRVFLYNGAKLEKAYRCAIGMTAYPTPRGRFKVIRKSAAPSWTNPYSSWSRSMPAYIRPGYYNPLGLRALYLNSPGIRIHGTSKTYSMGHKASHGCIRLTNRTIVDLYPRVKVGTLVYILR